MPVSYLEVELLSTVTNKAALEAPFFVYYSITKRSFIAGSTYRLPERGPLIYYQLSCHFVTLTVPEGNTDKLH